MFCKNCGKELNNDMAYCPYCGLPANKQFDGNRLNDDIVIVPKKPHSKAGLGVLFALMYGLLGLIIGLCLYGPYTKERETFVNGWSIMFVISLIPSIFVMSAIATIIGNIVALL